MFSAIFKSVYSVLRGRPIVRWQRLHELLHSNHAIVVRVEHLAMVDCCGEQLVAEHLRLLSNEAELGSVATILHDLLADLHILIIVVAQLGLAGGLIARDDHLVVEVVQRVEKQYLQL